ncbi:hypothetical protein ACFTWH_09830 [Streptomyces sp. NPDC057011]|uniref:hypothetical protein n=1 Tax=unclassified Streptomyces TaxID=2593676 RepID=UPI00362E2841
MTHTTRDGERPVEVRLRQALDARAESIEPRMLRPAQPPRPQAGRLPVERLRRFAVPLGVLAAAAAAGIGYLLLAPDQAPGPVPPATPPRITAPGPSPETPHTPKPQPSPSTPDGPDRSPSASVSAGASAGASRRPSPSASPFRSVTPFPPASPSPSVPASPTPSSGQGSTPR